MVRDIIKACERTTSPTGMDPIRIIVADDDSLVRETIVRLLEEESDLKVVGEAEDGISAVNLALELLPDLILMDMLMPNLSGMEATRRIINQTPEVKVIALSAHFGKTFVNKAMKAGVWAFVNKSQATSELINIIRETAGLKSSIVKNDHRDSLESPCKP